MLRGREESGKPDSDLEEPSWIMTVKGAKPLLEENYVKKVQNGSVPPQSKAIIQESSNLNHYRRPDKTQGVRFGSRTSISLFNRK